MVLGHQCQCVTDSSFRADGDRIVNHTVLRPFHTADLLTLLVDGHVLVNYADTAGTSHCNSEFSLCNSVHCGRHDRSAERNISSELSGNIYSSRQDLGACRNEQNVIEGKSFWDFCIYELHCE